MQGRSGHCVVARTLLLAAAAGALALLPGCLQLNIRISLQPDGSAVITERVRFSRELLDLGGKAAGQLNVAPLLEKKAFLDRMKHMGEGIKLVSHKVSTVEKGSREAAAVFRISDIRKLKYVSPFLAVPGREKRSVVAFDLFPVLADHWAGRRAGQMAVTVKPMGKAPRRSDKEEKPKGPSPRQLQILRSLRPVFRNMMKDFRLKLTFESYAPLRFRQYYRYRGRQAGTKEFDLLDFSDSDLDTYGYGFLDNEEVMLELLRGQINGPNLLAHVREHGTNLTLPVFHPTGVPEIYFAPSRKLFDKHLAGKTLTPYPRRGKPRKANFKIDGWLGDQPGRKEKNPKK